MKAYSAQSDAPASSARQDRGEGGGVPAPTDAVTALQQEIDAISADSVARALAADYLCVYYINLETNRFALLVSSEPYRRLGLEPSGEDFFAHIRQNAPRVVCPDDLGRFESSFSREKLLSALDTRPSFTITFRLIFNGAPRYVHMKATRMRDRENGALVAVSDIDQQMRETEEYERTRSSSLTYARIAQALSKDYFRIYYVDLETDQFIEYSSDTMSDALALERRDEGFFTASRQDTLRVVFAEDQARVVEAFTKENVIRSLDDHGVFTLNYRLLIDGAPTYVSMKATRMEGDPRHIIIGVNNIDAQMKHQEALERIKEERITYARITALSGDYIVIYTVDPETDRYTEYSATPDYEELGFAKEGDDFFAMARADGTRTLYLEDLDAFLSIVTKENILDAIARNGVFSFNYRLMIEGEPTYVCLKAAMVEEKDGPQLIVGLLNINEQVRRDLEYASMLKLERNKANYDALTGVKNKHAYIDVEAQLNHQIEEGNPVAFALVVCDVNDLKRVNDTHGHQAGDRYLQQARSIICHFFRNSPVFRVGGDEFAIIVQGQDYESIDEQIAAFDARNRANRAAGEITIARGMARYEDGDRNVAAVFERADNRMYENKRRFSSK